MYELTSTIAIQPMAGEAFLPVGRQSLIKYESAILSFAMKIDKKFYIIQNSTIE